MLFSWLWIIKKNLVLIWWYYQHCRELIHLVGWGDMKVKYGKVSQFLLWLLTVDPAPQHISRSGHVWSRNAKSLSVPATSGQSCSFAIKQKANANIKNYLWIHHCSSSQSHTHMTHIQATKIRRKPEIYTPATTLFSWFDIEMDLVLAILCSYICKLILLLVILL